MARRRVKAGASGWTARLQSLLVWIMPVGLALGFLFLLGSGNPILSDWLARLDPRRLLELLDPDRIVIWTLAIGFAWPFLRPRIPRRRTRRIRESEIRPKAMEPLFFGSASVLRALVLFNAVFAVQTILDAVYLWGGAGLPEGVSYASYAHRGAYTLVVTALLAAAFVLLALRPGTPAESDRRIRLLVYAWIAQNVVLVVSSMLRLDLYVDVYALTHWRLAAFVWMGVVAVGLVLICLRIARGASNRWLVRANVLLLVGVLAASCLVDDDALIADFNVDRSPIVTGRPEPFDSWHLASLGPSAIPAIDRLLAAANSRGRGATTDWSWDLIKLRQARRSFNDGNTMFESDWRRWTFRRHRLSIYLQAHPMPLPSPATSALPSLPDGPN